MPQKSYLLTANVSKNCDFFGRLVYECNAGDGTNMITIRMYTDFFLDLIIIGDVTDVYTLFNGKF